jgi:hypothetical protein
MKVLEIQDLKIKNMLKKEFGKNIKKMIKMMSLKKILFDKEKKEIVERKHNKSYVGMSFHLILIVMVTYLFDYVTINFVKPFPTFMNKYNFILLLIDITTKFIFLKFI